MATDNQDTLDPEPPKRDQALDMIGEINTRLDRHDVRLRDLETGASDIAIACTDLTRCVEGIRQELSKTNARMDALVADREKHQRRLDDRLEEVIESTQEAEKAFIIRIERAEKKRDAAYGEIAELKRAAAKGDQE